MIPDELITSIDELIDLETKKIELLRQMKRWYMLAKLTGMAPKEIKGGLSCGVHTYGTPLYSRPWKAAELVIRLDGEEVAREEVARKKLIDVPLDFWPDDMRIEYERVQRRNKVMREA